MSLQFCCRRVPSLGVARTYPSWRRQRARVHVYCTSSCRPHGLPLLHTTGATGPRHDGWVRRRPLPAGKLPALEPQEADSRTSVIPCSTSAVHSSGALLPLAIDDASSDATPSLDAVKSSNSDDSPSDAVCLDFTTCSSGNHNLEAVNREGRLLNATHALHDIHDRQKVGWFPYLDQFQIRDSTLTSAEVIEMLSPFILDARRKKIDSVIANRTYSVCPVVEGLVDLGNIAAVFRSADALGFQSVHVISNETTRKYKRNRKVSMGSEKWLDAELFEGTEVCLEELRLRGYRIAVASVTGQSVSIFDMDWTVPTAVVFGNEFSGASMEALEMSDMRCRIPMVGMVDSLNVSVAAGIVMQHAVNDRITRMGVHGDLSADEQRILCADFYLRHSSTTLSVLNRLVEKKKEEFIEKNQTNGPVSLECVLRGELEADIELPDYLKIDLEKISRKSDAD